MHLKVVIFALSFLTTSAYPLHHGTSSREAAWADPKLNQAHDKAELTKDVDNAYKSHVDSSGLYSQEDDHNKNPMVEEMRRKLNVESERLRTRLRQELAELRERLSPYPAHPSSALASMRERLAPLTQQLQSSLSSSTQDLCSQLSLYLQGLELAEAQAEASPALYRDALHWMSQTLEHSGSKLAEIISDFQTKSSGVIDHLKEISASEGAKPGLWQEMSSRLGQEVSSLRLEVQSRVGALKAELAALLITAQPLKAEVKASMDRFCQSAALQSQVFQARIERLFLGLEEEMEVQEASSPSSPSSSIQPGGSLQEDFSVKLSALIQDILHSVQ
ncbi:apolipoprotein A-IV [Centroberyx affinis]|uniref:apolipoprotein A-IV n=1 Tax=Centroberyx affinis TaxID=166261 RepID=UPI003A5C002E